MEWMISNVTNIHIIADGTIKGHKTKHTNEANNWNIYVKYS